MPSRLRSAALIPLRSGSKSIPNKNIRELGGFPMFYWATKAALDSGIFSEGVFIAVDNEQYFQIVRDTLPDAIPVMRPPETATDEASSESVLLWFVETIDLDVVALVQATTPTVEAVHFQAAWETFNSGEYDSLLSAVPFPRFFWDQGGKPLNYDPQNRPRRQDFTPSLVENGAFYFTKVGLLRSSRCRLGGAICVYPMPEDTIVELDEPSDWLALERRFRRRLAETARASVKLVVVDVDGTLTDGGMYFGSEGEMMKKFNTKDGAAIDQLRRSGLRVLVCTGEQSPSVDQRMKKLGITDYLPGVKDKVGTLSAWLASHGLTWKDTAYVGDELNDLEAIRLAAVSFCPRDAHPLVVAEAQVLSPWGGGEGVLRTVAEYLVPGGAA